MGWIFLVGIGAVLLSLGYEKLSMDAPAAAGWVKIIGVIALIGGFIWVMENSGGSSSRYDYEDDGRGNCPFYVPGGC